MITTAIQGTGRVNGGDTDVVPWFPLQGDQNWTPGIFQIADMVSKDHFYLVCTVCSHIYSTGFSDISLDLGPLRAEKGQ